MAQTIWWFMNTTITTPQKRQNPMDGLESKPKKFFGTWEQFESVLAGNSTGNQGIVKISNLK